MDFDLRLATLRQLADSASDAVQTRLGEELRRVETALEQSTDYDELEQALKILAVLAPKFHGAVVPTLVRFVRSVAARKLTEDGAPIPPSRASYRSAQDLIRDAIDVPKAVRYVHVSEVVDFLLELSRSPDTEVQNKAQQALEEFAGLNLHHFSTVGAGPQAAMVAHLGTLRDEQLVENAAAILRVLRAVLSPTMEGHASTYNTVTISRGSVPSGGGVAEMRDAAIELLKRMYPLEERVSYKKSVIGALDAATRREGPNSDANAKDMYERNAVTVLEFLRGLVAAEPLPVVQSVEHDAYWDYVHAISPAVEAAALAVRNAVVQHMEYQIYKQLIGFEGIFGQWEKLRSSEEEWDYSNTKRQEAARKYVDSIGEENYAQWRDRILEFSKTESDDLATFPVYYEFLELIGRHKPDLALELLSEHEARMAPFLIPLIGGLWESERQAEVDGLVQRWLNDGTHLQVIAKSLFNSGKDRLDTLSAVVARAAELHRHDALVSGMGVAARLLGQGFSPAKDIFMRGLRYLAERNDASWARAFWLGRDIKPLIETMDASERAEMLANMSSLHELDYQAEQVLKSIGEDNITAVLEFLETRIRHERDERAKVETVEGSERFEAIPYQLHSLRDLLDEYPTDILAMLRRAFDGDEALVMFPYSSGARLLQAVFPTFEPALQKVLLKSVEAGDPRDIELVVAILRAYGGSKPILDVCKAVIKATPEQSPIWSELAAALETTGAVWGEYGFVNAYESKRDEMLLWARDENERVRAFAAWLGEQLERLIERERQRADEDISLRKYKFGSNDGEEA